MSLDFMGFASSINWSDNERKANYERIKSARAAIERIKSARAAIERMEKDRADVYGCGRCDKYWSPENEHHVSRYLDNGLCPKCDRIIVREKSRGW